MHMRVSQNPWTYFIPRRRVQKHRRKHRQERRGDAAGDAAAGVGGNIGKLTSIFWGNSHIQL